MFGFTFGTRSLLHFVLFIEKNAKKHRFEHFSTLQTPKGALKSGNFAVVNREISQVRQAPSTSHNKTVYDAPHNQRLKVRTLCEMSIAFRLLLC